MEKINQLLSLQSDQSEDILLRDFVNKRAMLLNETMRTLANYCVTQCKAFEQKQPGKASVDQAEPRRLPKFTQMEEVCLAKCEAKMIDLTAVVERHVDESFNPAFVKKFI